MRRRICRRRSPPIRARRSPRPKQFWRDWTAKFNHDGPFADIVTRSLITLKALTYAPTGGIVAAPTTSLPERIGGVRNWDYRFCWLRDATLTLLALMNAGYYEEAAAWREWLLRAVAGRPEQVQIMYGIAGERRLVEWEVPWLPGFRNSAPVRIGNGAHSQLQLDVYGEVMDALHQARRGGLGQSDAGWAVQIAFLKHLETAWTEPDEGIWEVRSGRRHFTYSKVMAWVAFDRAIKSAEEYRLDGPLDHWRALRTQIHADVCRKGFDPEQQQLRAVLRLQGARREPAAAPGGRLPAAGRSARDRHGRGDRAPPDGRRIRAALRHRRGRTTACRPAKACSWRAASGWSTPM